MSVNIPVEVKKVCCQLKSEGKTNKEIYENYFVPETGSPSTLNSFRGMLNRWMKKQWADDYTLKTGTYEGFVAHDATVQVSKSGEIIQAWIKQKADDFNHEEFIEAIKEARALGDLSENAEYDAAKESQGLLEMKIAQLKDTLANARILDESMVSADSIQILSKVRVKDQKTGREMNYMLVSESEANIREGKLAVTTPIAKALMGKKVGDVAEAKVPAGTLLLEILEISI